MSVRFPRIDLSRLPPPDAIEALDYEAVLADLKAALAAELPELTPVLELESEPAVKVLEVFAYYVLLVRARVNDAVRAVMLASAAGADLDQIAALFGVSRAVIDPGDPAAVPPVPPTAETDERFRARVQLSLQAYSTAGPRGAYAYHAFTASPLVRDVHVDSPAPGEVRVTVLGADGDGTPGPAVLAAVEAALNAEDVRPLCDLVTVQAASIVPYVIAAEIEIGEGPDGAVVLAEAEAAAQAYADAQHRLGRDVTISGLHAALHREGVLRVTLTAPAAEIAVDPTEAAFCTGIALTVAEGTP